MTRTNQICQTWLWACAEWRGVRESRTSGVGPGQRSRFLVLSKRSPASGDENDDTVDCYWINVLSVYLAYFILSLGTGSFELRGDGSIHEWTIENQTPAGSAKLNQAALDLAVFGVRVKTDASNTAVLMRTHPPKGYPGNYLNYVTTKTSHCCYLEDILLVHYYFYSAKQLVWGSGWGFNWKATEKWSKFKLITERWRGCFYW